jgi:hypothetical protein
MQVLYSYDDLNRMTEIKRYVDGTNDEILMDRFINKHPPSVSCFGRCL